MNEVRIVQMSQDDTNLLYFSRIVIRLKKHAQANK